MNISISISKKRLKFYIFHFNCGVKIIPNPQLAKIFDGLSLFSSFFMLSLQSFFDYMFKVGRKLSNFKISSVFLKSNPKMKYCLNGEVNVSWRVDDVDVVVLPHRVSGG